MGSEDHNSINVKIGKLQTSVDYIEERMGKMEKAIEKHLEHHDRRDEENRKRNWQLWVLIISVIIGGISGWFFALLK